MKIKYQYTYFISSFLIENYDEYVLNLLKDKRFKLNIFNKDKNVEIDNYFVEEVKRIMFNTIKLSDEEQKKLQNEDENILKLPSVNFEYLFSNAEAEDTEGNNSIFFKIDKLELMCFKTGIGFLIVKTYLDDNTDIKRLLDFNYKFTKEYLESHKIDIDDKITIKNSEYKDEEDLINLFKEITQNKLQEDTYTYSYVCIDGEDWNQQTNFASLENTFIKLANALPSNEKVIEEIETAQKSDFIKIGVGKNSTALITNSLETYNFTKLPFEYETKYLYSLIFGLYQKELLKRINANFKQKFKLIKKGIDNFINNVFIKEITKENIGTKLFNMWYQKLEIPNNYLEICNKYEMAYKDEKLRKTKRNNIIIWCILGVCVITNIINVIILCNISK